MWTPESSALRKRPGLPGGWPRPPAPALGTEHRGDLASRVCAVRPAGYDAGWEDRSRLAFGQCVTRVSLWEAVIMRNRTGWIFSLAGVMIFSGHARLRAQVVDKPQED